jgi:excisionase family DNA binding protein
MTKPTIQALCAIIRADASMTEAEKEDRIRKLTDAPDASSGPRLLRLAQVADRLACSKRSVGNLLREGALRALRLPGRKRALGVPESEVVRLLDVHGSPGRRRRVA